ncbi:heavy metal efflux pump, CzcA family protein, partial [Vibrio parahaemolyticus VPTS-2010]
NATRLTFATRKTIVTLWLSCKTYR